MSTIGWFALVVLPILGGLIAWAGDVIGYRLGKARRSLFGLRPRTTARLIGVGVGVLLPLIGVGTALLGSREVEDALFHLNELYDQRASLETRNQELAAETRQLEQQIKQARQQADRSERDVILYREHLDTAKQTLVQARRQIANTAQRLAAVQSSLSTVQTDLGNLKVSRDKLRGDMTRLREELARADADLQRTSAELEAETVKLASTREDVRRLTSMVLSPVILEPGHELVRIIIEVKDTLEATEAALVQALLLASEAARAQGAEALPGGLAVRLVLPTPPGYDPNQFAPEAEILNAFARELQQGGKRQFVVSVGVARRMYRNENAPAWVELKAWPYVRIFVENELIYAVTIDASAPRADVYTQLSNLITKIVRREAREKGLLPDAKTGLYGDVPPEQFLTALDQILAQKGPVQVRVLAAADTFITDPLLIRIEVGKAEKSQGE